MTCRPGGTHYACECQIERMARLVTENESLRDALAKAREEVERLTKETENALDYAEGAAERTMAMQADLAKAREEVAAAERARDEAVEGRMFAAESAEGWKERAEAVTRERDEAVAALRECVDLTAWAMVRGVMVTLSPGDHIALREWRERVLAASTGEAK